MFDIQKGKNSWLPTATLTLLEMFQTNTQAGPGHIENAQLSVIEDIHSSHSRDMEPFG